MTIKCLGSRTGRATVASQGNSARRSVCAEDFIRRAHAYLPIHLSIRNNSFTRKGSRQRLRSFIKDDEIIFAKVEARHTRHDGGSNGMDLLGRIEYLHDRDAENKIKLKSAFPLIENDPVSTTLAPTMIPTEIIEEAFWARNPFPFPIDDLDEDGDLRERNHLSDPNRSRSVSLLFDLNSDSDDDSADVADWEEKLDEYLSTDVFHHEQALFDQTMDNIDLPLSEQRTANSHPISANLDKNAPESPRGITFMTTPKTDVAQSRTQHEHITVEEKHETSPESTSSGLYEIESHPEVLLA